MNNNLHIAHLTSVHTRYDTRIFVKQCRSLAKQYSVSLVVADNLGNEHKDNVSIYDVGRLAGRVNRVFKTSKMVLQKAIELDADIYHLHDPELIPIGLKLLKHGKKVIFDAHEDLPKQILNKVYLPPLIRKPLSTVVAKYEHYALRKFSGVVAATPYIRDKFLSVNSHTIDINNFPILDELASIDPIGAESPVKHFVYLGGIAKVRGAYEIVQAAQYLPEGADVVIAGQFFKDGLEPQLRTLPGWSRVSFLGFLDRQGVRHTLANAYAGLVTLHPTPNYLDSLPVKMFEYMAASIPVIASDFPLWKSIVDEHRCGLYVDPLNVEAVRQAMQYLYDHPQEALKMGEAGRAAVLQKYNWSIEEQKLFVFYQML